MRSDDPLTASRPSGSGTAMRILKQGTDAPTPSGENACGEVMTFTLILFFILAHRDARRSRP